MPAPELLLLDTHVWLWLVQPVDRIIVATAWDLGACLLTRDGKILEYPAYGFLAAGAI